MEYMLKIRSFATMGIDRAIIAMRREHGGREVSDSEWQEAELFNDNGTAAVYREFVIGPQDKAECLRLIRAGEAHFLKFVAVWARIEAPAKWWSVYSGYFIAKSDVERHGDMLTRSVMTTYANLLNLIETVEESSNDWKMQGELYDEVEKLPESWLILPSIEKREG